MTMMKPRPSALPHLEACPRWSPRPDKPDAEKNAMDEAADEGTLVHGKMEHLATQPLGEWDAAIVADADLSSDLRQVVMDCAQQVSDLFIFGLPVVSKKSLGLATDAHYELGRMTDEQVAFAYGVDAPMEVRAAWNLVSVAADAIYCEVGVDPGITAPGTADLVFVQGNRAVLVDYKTNRVLRAHDRQQQAYIIGCFAALPQVDSVESRLVCPRLGVDAHPPVMYLRSDIPKLEAELNGIVTLAADPFEPGCPGSQCAFCAGNGRCPWQAASLRDIPADVFAMVAPAAWQAVLSPETPEIRGQRRALVKWLDGFIEAVKDDDKAWALANPDTDLPGWTKSVGLGRASLDDTRLKEANAALSLTFGLSYDTLVSFLKPDKAKLAEFLALVRGMSDDEAKKEVSKALAPFEKRGAPIISFRAEKRGKKELKAS